jgi:ATP-dependent DNA helicase RecG
MENQNTEWKESWHDEYLKWVCGFANAQGGCLEIGKNDKGRVVGISNVKKLLTEIPNKIRTAMAIIADIDHFQENGLDYLVIKVDAQPNLISYHGKYYFRSGSTNLELTGNALDGMILSKFGRTWDSAPVPRANLNDVRQRIIYLMSKNPKITIPQIAQDIGVVRNNVVAHIRVLKKQGLVERIGAQKKGVWVVQRDMQMKIRSNRKATEKQQKKQQKSNRKYKLMTLYSPL